MWVRIDELTDAERNVYDEEEGKKKSSKGIVDAVPAKKKTSPRRK